MPFLMVLDVPAVPDFEGQINHCCTDYARDYYRDWYRSGFHAFILFHTLLFSLWLANRQGPPLASSLVFPPFCVHKL